MPHQEISTQVILIHKSHLGMMTRHQYHTPYLVHSLLPTKNSHCHKSNKFEGDNIKKWGQ